MGELACPHLSRRSRLFLPLSPYSFTSNLLLSHPVTVFFFSGICLDIHIVSRFLTFQHLLCTSHLGARLTSPPFFSHCLSLHLSLSLSPFLSGIGEWLVRTHSHFPSMCRASETPVCPQHLGQLCQGRSDVGLRVVCVFVWHSWAWACVYVCVCVWEGEGRPSQG